MFEGLSLITLALSALSEGEGSGEESWVQRFEEVNALRSKYGIPVLTARERMEVMLGEPPSSHLTWAIRFQENSLNPNAYDTTLDRYDGERERWTFVNVLRTEVVGSNRDEDKKWEKNFHLLEGRAEDLARFLHIPFESVV